MGPDPLERILAGADRPVAPRREFAAALLDQLLTELERAGGVGAPAAGGGLDEPAPAGPIRVLVVPGRGGTVPRLRPSALAQVTTAALLVLTLAAGYAAIRLRPEAGGDRPASPEWASTLLLRVNLEALPAGSVGARLERWSFPAEANESRAVAPSLPMLLYVEAGRLTATVEAGATVTRATAVKRAAAPVPPGYPAGLRTGDLLVVPAGARFALRHDGPVSPTVLVVVLAPAAEPEPAAFAPPGVSARTLGTGTLTGFPGGPGSVALRRLAVAPTAAIPVETAAGPEMLVVEAGVAGLRQGPRGAEVTRGAGGDASTVVPAGTLLALRNAGDEPLGLLRLTIAAMATVEAAPTVRGDPPGHAAAQGRAVRDAEVEEEDQAPVVGFGSRTSSSEPMR